MADDLGNVLRLGIASLLATMEGRDSFRSFQEITSLRISVPAFPAGNDPVS